MKKDQTQAIAHEIQPVDNIVVIEEERMFTTSLIVAEAFEKEHKNVLRDIENLECSKEFHQLNFELCNYSSELSSKGRKYPFYRITRDGFAFLAMGFTGENAKSEKKLTDLDLVLGGGKGPALTGKVFQLKIKPGQYELTALPGGGAAPPISFSFIETMKLRVFCPWDARSPKGTLF